MMDLIDSYTGIGILEDPIPRQMIYNRYPFEDHVWMYLPGEVMSYLSYKKPNINIKNINLIEQLVISIIIDILEDLGFNIDETSFLKYYHNYRKIFDINQYDIDRFATILCYGRSEYDILKLLRTKAGDSPIGLSLFKITHNNHREDLIVDHTIRLSFISKYRK